MLENQASLTSRLALDGGTPVRKKPFPSWPVFGSPERQALLDVFDNGEWWYGKKVEEFEKAFAEFQDAQFGVTCCNGTIALELALRTLDIHVGDEVLVPAYTFIASATSIVDVKAIPVFVDIEEDTFNMDLNHAENLITDKTRAIMVVHFAGLPMKMDAVNAFAKKHGLFVIEDAAHSWGSQWNGVGTGAIGDLGTFSFQMTKNITAGEGGILVTNNKDTAELARSITHCGRIKGRPWYDHVNIGSNYRITELQAAILLAQLDRLEEQTLTRQRNGELLNSLISEFPGLYVANSHSNVTRRSYHLFPFRYVENEFGNFTRDQFIEAMNSEGIPTTKGYLTTVYGNECFQTLEHIPGVPDIKVNYKNTECPVAERLTNEEMVWFSHSMLLGTEDDMRDIYKAIKKIYTHQMR